MFGKLLGAIVGREIDRRDGKGGMKGALLGAAAASIIRRVGPFGLLVGGAWVAKKAFDRHKAERRVAEVGNGGGTIPPII